MGPAPKRTYWLEVFYINQYASRCEENEVPRREANLVSSLCVDGGHAPAIDIDYRVQLEGNLLTFRGTEIYGFSYTKLAQVMSELGLITSRELERIQRLCDGRIGERFVPAFRMRVKTRIRPSQTKGHFHLFIDVRMRLDHYLILLEALDVARIVDHNFFRFTENRGMSMLFIPGREAKEVHTHA